MRNKNLIYRTLHEKINLLVISTLLTAVGFAQGVGINDDGSMPVDGAILDVKSNNQGMLIPRMTEAQRDAITPDTQSMLIYQTNNDSGFYYYDGSNWNPFLIDGAAANSGWSTKGNTGTTVGTHFIGTTDAEDFAIYTNNVERVRVLASGTGGVGIGTTPAPGTPLHIMKKTGSSGNLAGFVIERTFGSALAAGSNTTTGIKWETEDSDGNVQTSAGIYGGFSDNTAASHKSILQFYTVDIGGTTLIKRMAITEDGNVSIGTTTPNAKFTVLNSTNTTSSQVAGFSRSGTGASGNGLFFTHGSAAADYNSITKAGDAGIFFDTDGNPTVASSTTGLTIAPHSVSGLGVLGIRIVENGNVGIGTAAPTNLLSVNGTANNPAGAWGVFSDARIKKVNSEFTDGLEVVKRIRPVRFNYKKTAPFASQDEQIGIVAQELEKIAPYMVDKYKWEKYDDFREVNNQAYVFLLINAIKDLSAISEDLSVSLAEQQQIIEGQKGEIEDLRSENAKKGYQSEIDELKAELEKIKKMLNQQTKK